MLALTSGVVKVRDFALIGGDGGDSLHSAPFPSRADDDGVPLNWLHINLYGRAKMDANCETVNGRDLTPSAADGRASDMFCDGSTSILGEVRTVAS